MIFSWVELASIAKDYNSNPNFTQAITAKESFVSQFVDF